MTVSDLPPREPPWDSDALDHQNGVHAALVNADPLRDHQAELALIGAALTSRDAYIEAAEWVGPRDFDDPKHETVWAAIGACSAEGPYDAGMVLSQLRDRGNNTDAARCAPILMTAVTQAAIRPAVHWYAKRVKDRAVNRKASDALLRAHQQITTRSGSDDPVEALAGGLDTLDAAFRAVLAEQPPGDPAATAPAGLADLTWLLDGTPPIVEPPVWGKRTDGAALFYAGRVNGIFGDPEAAKSWIALSTCVEALQAGCRAAYVDVDHNGQQLTAERLLLLGATPAQIADRELFVYLEPEDAGDLRHTIGWLVDWRPEVAVLDSIGEMLPMLGLGTNDNDETTAALRALASPLANVGACVITIDHQAKDKETKGSGWAIGAVAKKRAIDGAYLHADARLQPAPGHLGKITLRVEKDRPGRLRAACTGKFAGTFILDSTQPHFTRATIDAESVIVTNADGHSVFRPTGVMERASRYVEDHPGATGRELQDELKGKASVLRAALERLQEEGYLTTNPGPKRATLHHSIKPYREHEDELE